MVGDTSGIARALNALDSAHVASSGIGSCQPICMASYNRTEPPPLNPGQPLARTTAS